MICSSVNLDCFIRPSLRWARLYLRLEEMQGVPLRDAGVRRCSSSHKGGVLASEALA